MDTFENASRGSWGSLLFLFSLPRLYVPLIQRGFHTVFYHDDVLK